MATQLQEIPFTNSLGQVINPGDDVLSIASGRGHYISMRRGTYLGVVNGSPSVLVEVRQWGYWQGDKNVGYSKGYKLGLKGEHRAVKRRSTLPLGRVFKLA